MSPLITRRAGSAAMAAPAPRHWHRAQERSSGLMEDAKLFATGWVGGLIFFGTFLG